MIWKYYDKNNNLIKDGDTIKFEDGTKEKVTRYEDGFGDIQFGIPAYNPKCAFANTFLRYPLNQFSKEDIEVVEEDKQQWD